MRKIPRFTREKWHGRRRRIYWVTGRATFQVTLIEDEKPAGRQPLGNTNQSERNEESGSTSSSPVGGLIVVYNESSTPSQFADAESSH